MMRKENYKRQIEKLWKKPCNNASDAHFRAQEIERLQKLQDEEDLVFPIINTKTLD